MNTATPSTAWGVVEAESEAVLMVVIPHLPRRSLGANTREHYYAKGKAVREERQAFGLEIKSCLFPFPLIDAPVRLRWVLYVEALRGDVDNWVTALKPWQDALVDIGLLPNDGPRTIRGLSVEVVKDRARAPRTELYILPGVSLQQHLTELMLSELEQEIREVGAIKNEIEHLSQQRMLTERRLRLLRELLEVEGVEVPVTAAGNSCAES